MTRAQASSLARSAADSVYLQAGCLRSSRNKKLRSKLSLINFERNYLKDLPVTCGRTHRPKSRGLGTDKSS